MSTLLQDLRYGVRTLVRNPGFTAVVVFTLALAIGADSVLFSFVNVLMLKPLPIKDLDSVAFIEGLNAQRADDWLRISEPDYLDYRERARSFEDTGAYSLTAATLTGEGHPRRVLVGEASASFFQIWGLEAVVGRAFRGEEDRPGAPGVVLVSHGFWMREFGEDPSVVGRTLTLNGRPHVAVGVLTPRIEIGTIGQTELWVPLAADPGADRNERALRVFGRLRPEVSVEAASNEVAAIAKRLQDEHPDSNTGFDAVVRGGRESLMGGANTRLIFGLLSIVVVGVLVVACANVANLMLSRAVGRRRELAVRSALGASRVRVVRQLVTESVVLSVLGGIGGLAMAAAALKLVRATAAEPAFEMIVVDRDVLIFAAGLSLLTPLVFGLLPALQASRRDIAGSLKDSGSAVSGGMRGKRSRGLLVVSQLTLACALLIGSGLVVRTVFEVSRIDWGFDHRNLLTFQVELPEARYPDDARLRGFFDETLPGVRAIPGVSSAAAVSPMPIFGDERTVQLEVEGREVARPEDRPWAVLVVATDAYLETVGLPLLRGRSIDEHDAPDGTPVAVVSRELARRYWPDEDAIGRRLAVVDPSGPSRRWLEVVGVSGDLRSPDVTDAPKPTVFVPLTRHPPRLATVVVRGASDPGGLVSAIRDVVRGVDAELPIFGVGTMEQTNREQAASDRILQGMFMGFAVIALLMAAAGLYATMSYSVSQRRREIGVRMALGARGRDVLAMILGQGARLAVPSLGLGVLGGLGFGKAMASLLYGVSATDPLTYGGVTLTLAAIALLASYGPALRATRVDPIQTLRAE